MNVLKHTNPGNKNPAASFDEPNHPVKPNKNETLYCSFCGKSQHDVLEIIAGPNAQICELCTELCIDIVLEEVRENNTELKNTPMLSSLVRGMQREDDQPKSRD